MGWARTHMTEEERRELATSLFTVQEERGAWLNGLCPFHEDRNPSFGYNVEEDVYKCLASCTDSGDLVKLYGLVRGLPNETAFRELRAKYHRGGARSGKPITTSANVPATQKPKEGKEGLVIPEAVWQRMAPLPEDWVQELERERGWSREVLQRLDVRMQTVYRDTQQQVQPLKGASQRVAIPVRDTDGLLRNIRLYRRPGASLEKKIISWGRGYGSARLFPATPEPGKDPVILCEGEPDTICALSQGFNAITQTSKTERWSQEQRSVFQGRDVVICYDADQPGQSYAESAARNLVNVAASVRILVWPEYMGLQPNGEWPADHGQDLTDFFVRHNRSSRDLQELFAKARVIERVSQDTSGGSFFIGRSFKPRLLADRLLADQPLLYDDETGIIYRWNGVHWERIVRGLLQRLAAEYLGIEAGTSRVNDAVSLCLSLSTLPHGRRPNDRQDWVCLRNGMLNLRTLELRPHAQDDYATFALGVVFDPDSSGTCESWLRFLDANVQTAEPIAQLQEFAGYCLTRETRFEKCLLLLGDGSDGKSTFLGILRAMVGEENCSAVAFQDLEDQFRRASLYNKLLNISTEVGSQALETPVFKAVVTGDPIQASFKHKDGFEFSPFCKLAFAANKLPRVLDNTDGFFRRMLPVRFKRQYLEGDPERDNHLRDKLLAELSEIFAWALVGLHRLWAQGRFTGSQETMDILMDYRRLNNPVQAFVEDACEIKEGARADKDSLYDSYRKYCSRSGYSPMHKENFFRELYAAVSCLREARPRIEGRRPRMVEGIVTKWGPED